MSNSISTSLNMRSLKEAMESQVDYETNINELEIDDTDESLFELPEIKSSTTEVSTKPIDQAQADMDELGIAVNNHEVTADDVLDKALDAYNAIFTAAQSVPPDKSARLFEVAAQYLDIINKTSDSKVSARHDKAKLSVVLTKAKIQAGMVEEAVDKGIKAHRNDILKAIMGGDIQDADFESRENEGNSKSEENK